MSRYAKAIRCQVTGMIYAGGEVVQATGRAIGGPADCINRLVAVDITFDMVERLYAMVQEQKIQLAKANARLAEQNARNGVSDA